MPRSDPCSACLGHGGHPVLLDEAEDFRISRGWASCSECGGTGDGEEQRRIAARLEDEIKEVLGD